MESKKRKTTRRTGGGITIVDVVILLLVLVTVGVTVFGWVYQSEKNDRLQEAGENYIVTFRVESTHRRVPEGIEAADRLYLVDDSCYIGYLHSPLVLFEDTSLPAAMERVTATGSMVCKGSMDGRSLQVNGSEYVLTPGDVLRVRTEREVINICILDISDSKS